MGKKNNTDEHQRGNFLFFNSGIGVSVLFECILVT